MKTTSFIRAIVISATLPVTASVIASVNALPPEPGKVPRITAVSATELKAGPGKEVILDVYTVRSGDWLTKIAAREYGNSSLWTVIHGYNNYVKDPHWIFPGDNIILPRVVDKIPEPVVQAVNEEPAPVVEDERDFENFLAPPDFEFAGIIAGFISENLLQAQGDYCYLDIGSADGIKEDMRFNIYEKGRTAVNPETGDVMGEIYSKVGQLRVTGDIFEDRSTARIVYADHPLKSGSPLLISR